jgi:hypothetical protein
MQSACIRNPISDTIECPSQAVVDPVISPLPKLDSRLIWPILGHQRIAPETPTKHRRLRLSPSLYLTSASGPSRSSPMRVSLALRGTVSREDFFNLPYACQPSDAARGAILACHVAHPHPSPPTDHKRFPRPSFPCHCRRSTDLVCFVVGVKLSIFHDSGITISELTALNPAMRDAERKHKHALMH